MSNQPEQKPPREVVRLTLQDAGPEARTFNVRLRRALKALLRWFGLKLIRPVEDLTPKEPETRE